jgi:hypothetical protein
MLACGFCATLALAGGMARSGSGSQGRDAGVMFNLPRRAGLTVLPTSEQMTGVLYDRLSAE